MRLLLIEDSRRLRATVAKALGRLGHAVDEAADATEAKDFAAIHEYDVIILDLLLPGQHGLELLAQWRRSGQDTPVIILTALDGIDDRVRGLSMGADDYLVKPFALAELAARIEVLARRRQGRSDSRQKVGPLEIDLSGKQAWLSGQALVLTAREFSLLECLARRPGQTMTREQIEASLYNEAGSPLSNAVDAAVYSLRKKISPPGSPELIHTRRGLGYVLEA